MTFAEKLKPHAARLGTTELARLCGVTPRAIQLWIAGKSRTNAATEAGALFLLGRAKTRKRAR